MKITVIYDNRTVKAGLETGWGFSSLVETDDTPPLLFDTGADGIALLNNMKQLGIDPALIGAIVISHHHYDHTGGLPEILEINKHAVIYVPVNNVISFPGRKVVQVSKPTKVSESVFSTGKLRGIEQALAVKTGKGIVVVTGCSHPGVGEILDAASCYGKVFSIIGGLHGFHDFEQLNGLSLICPCHCTQHKAELKSIFPNQYVNCGAGLELNF